MKSQNVIVLGLAGLAVYMIWKTQSAAGKAGNVSVSNALKDVYDYATKEVLDQTTGKAYDNGWRYFTNGIAISPDGTYYQNGKLVYSPSGGGASGGW